MCLWRQEFFSSEEIFAKVFKWAHLKHFLGTEHWQRESKKEVKKINRI